MPLEQSTDMPITAAILLWIVLQNKIFHLTIHIKCEKKRLVADVWIFATAQQSSILVPCNDIHLEPNKK